MHNNDTALHREAKQRWEHTYAWHEYVEKNVLEKARQEGKGLMQILSSIGALRHLCPGDAQVQERIAALQQYITAHFYTCTDEILMDLGRMYIQDERFRKNIDNAGGKGTAEFAGKAIAIYCSTHQ